MTLESVGIISYVILFYTMMSKFDEEEKAGEKVKGSNNGRTPVDRG